MIDGRAPWPFGTALRAFVAGRQVEGELLTCRGDHADPLLTLRSASGAFVEVFASACRPVAGLPEGEAADARRDRAPAAGLPDRDR